MRQERDDRVLGRNTLARETRLSEWVVEWWERYIRVPGRPGNTLENYERPINDYIAGQIGDLPMIDLTPPRIAEWRDDLLDEGVGKSAVKRAMVVLSSCLGRAVERGLCPTNPCNGVRKPSPGVKSRNKNWRVSPEEIEWLRKEFLDYRAPNSGAWIALRSATLVAVMGYAGLRPEEAMGLKVEHYQDRERALIVEDVYAAEHRVGDTKTHDGGRVVRLQDALAEDLRLWIDVLDESNPRAWLFPSEPGGEVTRSTHTNWTARPWKRARGAVVADRPEFARTLGDAKPKDLRAAFVSLLARAGRPDADIAEETGHTIEVLRKHYLGTIKRLRGLPVLPEGEQIRLAREKAGTSDVAQALRRELLADATRPKIRLVEPNPAASSQV